jgi:hypothetical protein
MSMYAELLIRAQGSLRDDLGGDALLCYTLDCRSELLASGPVTRATAISALAVEVAYDCALLKLCATEDIGAFPTDFSYPAEGRRRFELALKGVGIDLTSLARRWKGRQV